jgi:predicted DNA-binding transcriptional regulator YafY
VFGGDIDLAAVRDAIRNELKLRIVYRDRDNVATVRTVWPFLLAFFDRMRMIVAWCELRQGYRHFRADRIASMEVTDERSGRRRLAMTREWREQEMFRSPSETAARN